jgi:hypothetical protein
MPALLAALAAGSLALVPPADIRVAKDHDFAPQPRGPVARPEDCARRLDPSFVQFVAPAASSAGNPMLRLISTPRFASGVTLFDARPMSSCAITPLLTRNDDRP